GPVMAFHANFLSNARLRPRWRAASVRLGGHQLLSHPPAIQHATQGLDQVFQPLFEVAYPVAGGEHHLADLQAPGAIAAHTDLGVEGFAAEIARRPSRALLVGKDGVELDRMYAREVEPAFLHAPQNRVADIFVQG